MFFDCVWKEINDMGTFLHIDLVADNYQGSHPLKEQTLKNRGTGTTVAMKLGSKLPKNFATGFLNSPDNKDAM